MHLNQSEVLQDMYNLILNPGTREWERAQLITAKNKIETSQQAAFKEELTKLEAALRPLAMRDNLTPDVADFYVKITGGAPQKLENTTLERLPTERKFQERAIFAGGCFWCMVEPFEQRMGIISVLSGYTGGELAHPTYDQVSSGYSGHVEAVEIIFDTRIIRYQELIELYWQLTDPTDALGQFQDRGSQYRPIIFVQNEQQRGIAEQSKQQLIASKKYKKPIVTEIREATTFWPAENYHQQFYQKQPKRYRRIKRARKQMLTYQKMRNGIFRIFHGNRI